MLELINGLTISVFLELPVFQEAAQWIINQAKWVVLAAIIVLAIRAWFQGKTMQVFGSILVGLIILIFAQDGNSTSFVDNLAGQVSGILGLNQ